MKPELGRAERLELLPAPIRQRAIEFLRSALTPEDVARIREVHAERGDDWWVWISTLKLSGGRVIPRGHFDFGMRVRNALRENVCLDADLPRSLEFGWEDVYVPLVEIACGLRDNPFAGAEASAPESGWRKVRRWFRAHWPKW